MVAKIVKEYKVEKYKLENMVDTYYKKKVEVVTSAILNDVKEVIPEIDNLIKNRFVFMENKNVFYDHQLGALYPDFKTFFNEPNTLKFGDFTGTQMTTEDIKAVFNGVTDIPLKCKGKIIYVNANCKSNSKNGTSWENAFSDFQSALNAATNGDQIWVTAGEYVGAFSLKSGVEVYGGFTGTEVEGWQRDINKNVTIFKGNSEYVFNNQNVDATAKLSGCTITNPNGRGMYNINSSPFISWCKIENCGWGGIQNSSSSPTVINCKFIGNTVTSCGGGGICSHGTSVPFIINCNFQNNTDSSTEKRGGGVCNCNQTNLTNCTFSGNKPNDKYNYSGNINEVSFASLPDSIKKLMEAKVIPVLNFKKEMNLLQLLYVWAKNGTVAKGFTAKIKKIYENLLKVPVEFFKYLKFDEKKEIKFDVEKFFDDVKHYKFTLTINDINFDKQKIVELIIKGQSPIKFDESVLTPLLDCDKIKADIESYDAKILTDPNRGHWDLFEDDEKSEKDDKLIKIEFEGNVYAKDPKDDIKEGVVGIDFGTKSTIVVYQENTEYTRPMRIGVGDLSKDVEAKHFENPTVVEFINIENFMKYYTAKAGRPDTAWEDISISHTALHDLNKKATSKEFYTIFSELKQWAGDKKRVVRLKDKQEKEILLSPFLSLEDKDINPIEIYAYYIGSYINTMRNGIYTDYYLSFPVTYEKEVREKIVKSFEKGIKKSLPINILNDQKIMDNFRVISGASEPAAYAICALQEYKFEPTGDEKIFYGIFDFGGGTTDFDFGLWREANSEKKDEKRYDYVIEHFGAQGDRYLGGENLLFLLAYNVFKDNKNSLIIKKGKKENEKDENKEESKENTYIPFALHPEEQKPSGFEILIDESQEAKLNIKRVMEAIRPFMEKNESFEEQNKEKTDKTTEKTKTSNLDEFGPGTSKTKNTENTNDVSKIEFDGKKITLNLFDKNGNEKVGTELEFNKEKMQEILKNRIKKGVNQFFEALRISFTNSTVAKDVDKIHIFLAGNASKSHIVKKLFDEYISSEIENMKTIINDSKTKKKVESSQKNEFYEIYPPLGTKEATEIQKKKGFVLLNDKNLFEQPTGKTGVAFGLVRSRKGGRVLVIDKNVSENNEATFKYFIGMNKKGNFKMLFDRNHGYNQWVEFIDAGVDTFEIYYTTLPEATTGILPISQVLKKPCKIKTVDANKNIFIRAVKPTQIEYIVAANKEEAEKISKTNLPVMIELN